MLTVLLTKSTDHRLSPTSETGSWSSAPILATKGQELNKSTAIFAAARRHAKYPMPLPISLRATAAFQWSNVVGVAF